MKTSHYIVRLFLATAFVLFCSNAFAQIDPTNSVSNGSITFLPAKCNLTPSATTALDTLAGQMRYNPDQKVVILGNSGGSKVEAEINWNRVTNVIEYMTEHNNISRDRFISRSAGTATFDRVAFRVAAEGEVGPSYEIEPGPPINCQ